MNKLIPQLVVILATLTPAAFAQNPPAFVSFQGVLTDSAGAVVPDARYSMQFRLYRTPAGGSPVWSEDRLAPKGVDVADGRYNVRLGEVAPLDGVSFDRKLFLEVEVSSETIPPRIPLSAAPYALGLRLPFAGSDTLDSQSIFRLANEGSGSALQIDTAGGDGIVVVTAGNISNSLSSTKNNGLEIRGAQGYGVYVGVADVAGLRIAQAGMPSSSSSSLFGHDGIQINGTEGHGVYIGHTDQSGVHVADADYAGLRIIKAGDPSGSNAPFLTAARGIEINSAEGTGLYIGHTDGTGIDVAHADGTGLRISSSTTGAEISGSTQDLVLGGANGSIVTSSFSGSSDLYIRSYDDVVIHLDENGDNTGAFEVRSDADTLVFQVTENGNVYVGGILTHSSDANRKDNFSSVKSREVLEALVAMPVTKWQFKGDPVEHLGPTSQEFKKAFGLGDSATSIAAVDADGVSMAAIQALYQMILEQKDRIADLERRLGLE